MMGVTRVPTDLHHMFLLSQSLDDSSLSGYHGYRLVTLLVDVVLFPLIDQPRVDSRTRAKSFNKVLTNIIARI